MYDSTNQGSWRLQMVWALLLQALKQAAITFLTATFRAFTDYCSTNANT
ncbi:MULTISPECIES: hypothetical protein [Providencia]|nr:MULTISPECIES: hypothetical protein [Providencia]ELR5214250.1 hypothetical protein [Providencia rettgeri]HEM8294392.1 hypothetical protein [Providencia stuartii]